MKSHIYYVQSQGRNRTKKGFQKLVTSSNWLKATNNLIALATQKLDRELNPKPATHPTNLEIGQRTGPQIL